MPAVERAVLDLAAIVIGHHLAAADAAPNLDTLAGEGVAELAPAGDDEIGRPAIEWRRELAGRDPGSVDDGLIVPGQKPIGVAEPVDVQRAKILLEKFPGAVIV